MGCKDLALNRGWNTRGDNAYLGNRSLQSILSLKIYLDRKTKRPKTERRQNNLYVFLAPLLLVFSSSCLPVISDAATAGANN
jgi:hypothetical protein